MPDLLDCPIEGDVNCPTASPMQLLFSGLTLLLIASYLISRLRLPNKDESWTFVVDGSKKTISLPEEVVMFARVWGGAIGIGCFLVHLGGTQFSLPYLFIVYGLCISGFFVQHIFFQMTFHLCSSLVWVGIYDLLLYVRAEESFVWLLLSRKLAFWFLIATVIVVRFNLGNTWQYRNVYYVTFSFTLLIAQFWVSDSCTTYGDEPICRLLGQSVMSMQGYFTNRKLQLLKLFGVHILYNYVFSLTRAARYPFIAEYKNSSSSNDDSKESGGLNNISSAVTMEEPPRRFSGATDHEDDNQVIVDDSGQKRRLPDDCLEITEAEAIEIIQNGLNSFKNRRAT